jgi:hypothetical protein
MVSGPGTAVFLDDSDPNTSVTVSQYGEYVFAFTVGNGPCQVSDEVTVEFYLVEPLSVPPDGSGTMASPYLIQSLENLYWIAEQPNSGNNFSGKYFLQTNDIDLSETETWFCGRGWIPIGNYLTPFKGSYDGGSHSIVSLYINRPDENYIGLFGVVDNAVFRNLQLLDFDITGNKFVGSLSGSAKNTTNISYVDVNNAQIYLSENYGGGLVGQALYSTSIYRCSSSGEISKDGLYTANWIGGLAGSLAESAIVEESYSTTNVTSLKHNIYAGLVGVIWTGGIIRNSYARGSVTGTWAIAGGFVGDNQTGIIQTSYSTGLVSAPSLYVGGFIGRNLSGSYLNNFWDKETSGQTTSTGATGKTTSEMKTQTTFTNAGWDFQNVWRMDGVTNNGYPFLLWQVVPLVNTVTDISIPAGGMQCFDALQSIHVSDFTVEPDGRADFIAGQNIFFHPGTHVMPGGEMWARIAMNNQYCSQYTTLAPSLSKGSVMAAPLKTISAENSFFKVFPNPTPGRFTLELKEVSETSPVSVEMFTMIGEPVMKLDLPVMKQYMIDLSANQPGLYIIRVQQENELGVEKIIKQ